jgi:hypothetical protein
MVDLVKYLRNKDLAEYNNQLIDLDYYRLVNIWAKNYVGVYTNKDGNCLFHAISLNLFGSESYTFQIRLAAVFMCLEYEAFIRKYMSDYAYAYDFDALILKKSKFGEWGSEIHFLLFFLLLYRPVYSFTPKNSLFSNPSSASTAPLVVFLRNSHFVAGLRSNFAGQVQVPRCNQMRFYKGQLPIINFYL